MIAQTVAERLDGLYEGSAVEQVVRTERGSQVVQRYLRGHVVDWNFVEDQMIRQMRNATKPLERIVDELNDPGCKQNVGLGECLQRACELERGRLFATRDQASTLDDGRQIADAPYEPHGIV
jgi:hypothetical protein